MRTEVVDATSIEEAGTQYGAKIIRDGGLVAFPTETVYGLGANGLNPEAVSSIFEAKGRPSDNPLIMHISKKSEIRQLWDSVPSVANVLMDTFWPGPLTLIYKRSRIVPNAVTAGLDTVAVRLPANVTARALIRKAGVPIAAPSANLSGKPSPTTAQHVLEDMEGRIPLIIDGGPCKYGVESTVLSLIGTPTILRPGAVTWEMLSSLIGEVRISDAVLSPLKENETAASPGMKYKHYAPDAEVVVISGSPEKAAARINELYVSAELEGKNPEIAGTKQTKHFYQGKKFVILGDREKPETLCRNLFSYLRALDQYSDLILAEGISPDQAGLAYMNRLLRSAGFHVEYV